MARDNKKGTPFLALDLETYEANNLKEQLKFEDISAKQLMRRLIRRYLKENLHTPTKLNAKK